VLGFSPRPATTTIIDCARSLITGRGGALESPFHLSHHRWPVINMMGNNIFDGVAPQLTLVRKHSCGTRGVGNGRRQLHSGDGDRLWRLLPRSSAWAFAAGRTGSRSKAPERRGVFPSSEATTHGKWSQPSQNRRGDQGHHGKMAVLINALKEGIPGNGKPVPDGAMFAQNRGGRKKEERAVALCGERAGHPEVGGVPWRRTPRDSPTPTAGDTPNSCMTRPSDSFKPFGERQLVRERRCVISATPA